MGKTSKKSTNPVPKPKGSNKLGSLKQQPKKKGNLPGRSRKQLTGMSGMIRRAAPLATGLAGLPNAYFHSERSADGSLRVCGLENLGRLSTSPNLVLKESYSVNPLNEKLFPRTSVLALPFESYELHKLRFFYVPACQASLAGNVLMYYDYDPADSPKATDIDILAQTTKSAASMWCACDLNVDMDRVRKNRARYFVQSDHTTQGGNSLTAAEVRQDYAGTINVYCSDGPAGGNTFGGYLFVEYDLSLHTMIPARPVSAAWSQALSYSLAENAVQTIPFPTRDSGVGLIGGATDTAGSSWLSAGGIAGYLDGARQIYEAGEWLLNLRSSASAASFMKDRGRQVGARNPATPLPGAPDWLHVSEEVESAVMTIYKDPPVDPVTGFAQIRRARDGVGAAGDFTLGFSAYDVTDGVIDPNWPVSITGMTSAGVGQVVAYTTTAAFEASNNWNLSVPAGKRYMIRPYITVGATAGSDRTFSDVSLTANVVSDSE